MFYDKMIERKEALGMASIMQNSNIDWFMVDVNQKNLSEAMGFAKTAFNDDAASFFDKFTKSGYQKAFEKNSGRVTLGCSGSDLL
jgi:hypothetical protein